jgi:SHS2 domain-containing protein
MVPFEIVEHTADVGVHVRAADLETFFEDAARGMFHIICDEPVEGWPVSHEVALDNPALAELLVDWLSELLYLFEVKKFIFDKAAFHLLGDGGLRATVSGTAFRGEIVGTEIKAVTYHLLEVARAPGGYETTVYFDL